MKGLFRNKNKSVAEQIFAMRSKYPQFESKFVSHSGLKVSGILQPTSRSEQYHFILKYTCCAFRNKNKKDCSIE